MPTDDRLAYNTMSTLKGTTMIQRRILALVFSILAIVSTATADVTDFTYTPTSPVMGQIVTHRR